MRILITGGAGFIGSAVIRHLVSHTDNSVINVDKLTYAGNLESLTSVSESDRYVPTRITWTSQLDKMPCHNGHARGRWIEFHLVRYPPSASEWFSRSSFESCYLSASFTASNG